MHRLLDATHAYLRHSERLMFVDTKKNFSRYLLRQLVRARFIAKKLLPSTGYAKGNFPSLRDKSSFFATASLRI
ncbi:MAG: hypothetical protein ABIQ21_02905 [Chryseolinea sp.]